MASNQNIENATQAYESFLGLMKWGTIAAVILAALVVLLLAS